MQKRLVLVSIGIVALGACDGAPVAMVEPDGGPQGLAVLGAGTHDLAALEVVEVATRDDGLLQPRDIAFGPMGDHELWILNSDSGMVIVSRAGFDDRSAVRRRSLGYEHFMPSPSAMAFGGATMATVHETDEVTQPTTPADFMGPSLWPIDPATFDGGHGSHLDMLHHSPNAVGIAWDSGNAFWVLDGFHQSITFYDFGSDHGPGGADHSDGVIARWVDGQVEYIEGVSSHMELDHASGLLYLADSGNARVATLDTRGGTHAGSIGPNYDGAEMMAMDSAPLATLVDGTTLGMERPSGLALRDGILYVGDRATSRVHAFDLSGAQLDWLDLASRIEPGSLGALELDAEGRLYVADVLGHRVLRIAPPTS